MRTAARTTTTALTALTALLAASLLAASPAAAAACSDPGSRSNIDTDDINGDGFADTVVTEYGRDRLAGGVHVLYGTADGLTADAAGTAPDDQFVTQSSRGVPGSSEAMDEWGAALVSPT